MKTRNKVWAFLVILLLILGGCGSLQTDAPADSDSLSVSAVTSEAEQVTEDSPATDSDPVDLLESPTPLQGGAAPTLPGDSSFTVYFIDVGQADSALVVCDGATMLIDGGNVADSSLIYAFLKNHGVTHLDYVVATHAHEDHVGGLAGALNYATASVAFSPVTSYNSKAFNDFVKYLSAQKVSLTAPKPGDKFKLGGADVLVMGPVKPSDEPNNTSIVLKITYGKTGFLFAGDAERAEEQDILNAGYDLSANVLKVGHHGSDTSTTYPFLREIAPEYAVISCGVNNSYGHPHENLLSRLRDADVTVFRTDMQGDIVCVSDGEKVSFTTQRNASAQTNPTASGGGGAGTQARESAVAPAPAASNVYYIGNINSLKYHLPSCRSLPAEKNRVIFNTKDEARSAGYTPCGICKP